MFLRLASHYREAYSMMGEGWYDATDITCESAVKFMLFRCEIQLRASGAVGLGWQAVFGSSDRLE